MFGTFVLPCDAEPSVGLISTRAGSTWLSTVSQNTRQGDIE